MYSLCGALNIFIISACRDERYSLRKYYFKFDLKVDLNVNEECLVFSRN